MREVETIKAGEEIIAIIIPAEYTCEGTEFFTPNEFSQQLGFIQHKAGDKISDHTHKPVERIIRYTQEVLFIKSGEMKANLFDGKRNLVCSKTLSAGDVIILVSGGHGFEFLGDTEIIEVKQGPYLEEDDKEWYLG